MYFKRRTKKGIFYGYCTKRRSIVPLNASECYTCANKEYKTYKPIKKVSKKRSRRTKEVSISQKVKEEVFKRDNGKCIFCGRDGLPECHYIKRSQNGLGIAKNIFTGCRECHTKFDESKYREDMIPIAKKYFESIYSDWKEEELYFHKYNFK
jgi:5-methylcytosine-specific restriction endonuclease McrA